MSLKEIANAVGGKFVTAKVAAKSELPSFDKSDISLLTSLRFEIGKGNQSAQRAYGLTGSGKKSNLLVSVKAIGDGKCIIDLTVTTDNKSHSFHTREIKTYYIEDVIKDVTTAVGALRVACSY